MANETDVIEITGDGQAAAIDFKFRPDQLALVVRAAEIYLEAGYDISISRVFDDTFIPPIINHYVLSVIATVGDVEES